MIAETAEPLIVIPPPEIRKILDKTAHFVARNGPSFEERIKENEKMNNKFAFLNQNDPYRPYYDKRVKEFKEGTADIKPKADAAKAAETKPAPVVKPPPKEPKPLSFLIDTPPIPSIDYELIKLTALFVARNGRSFMNNLAKKEARNFQFDFLKSNHGLFGHFTRLVEMYSRVLNPKKEMLKDLERFVESKFNALEDIYGRVAYQRHQEETARKEKEKVEEEKVAFASIDWHDFVVVETIEFTVADSESNLPLPMSLQTLENLNNIKKKADKVFEEIEADKDIMKVDAQVPSKASPPKGPPPKAPEIPVPKLDSREVTVSSNKKIRTDYVPKVGKIGVAEPTQLCPRCGIAVKVSEMEEHVRIELLDPKWRQQKAVYESRLKGSNLILGKQDISKNLSRLSDHRSDIFGSEASEDSKKLIEQEKKASAEKAKNIWDGTAATAPKALKKVQSNIESVSDKTIGPQIPPIPPIPGSKNIPPIPKIPIIPPLPGTIRPPSLPINIPPPPKPVAAPSTNGGSVHASKKRKQDEPPPEGLLPESEFLSKYSGPVNLRIKALDGSEINLDGLDLSSTVNSIKDKIAPQVGLAASKLKLVTLSGIAMRNAMTLAYYNLVTGSVLNLSKKKIQSKMVHKRKKRRTHVPIDPSVLEKIPKSFVVKAGSVSADVAQLVTDLRRVMEPNTATHLKEREKNKIRDFVAIAGQLSVTHMLMVSESESSVNLKVGRLPRGPTVYFKVESFSLSKDVLALQKNPKSPGSDFKTPPLVILNNFNSDEMHLSLVSTALQNLFPAIKLGTMKLAECRRVVLFDFDEETKQIEFRHYSINVKLTGVSKSIKNLISANLEDLEKFNDISDYILKASLLSESDVEDAGESTVTLPEKYVGKGNSKSEERAIRLVELGPRMSLSINKIVSNLMSGDVLYHSYISKTREQVKELEKNRKKREEIKAKRRAIQEANVKAKALKNKKDDTVDGDISESDEQGDADDFGSDDESDNDTIEEKSLSEDE